jgi:hypothetical protein
MTFQPLRLAFALVVSPRLAKLVNFRERAARALAANFNGKLTAARVLAQLKLSSLPEVLGNLNGMWGYASTEWLKLCEPNEADRTRSRWPIHPLWLALAAVDWETKGGPLSREFKPTNAPSEVWLGQRALSLLASVASVKGLGDFDAACSWVASLADRTLGDAMVRTGIGQEQLFAELVEICNRKYSLRLNERDPEPEDPMLQNPYYRAKQGMQ